MLSASDRAIDRINRMAAESEADDLECLADQIDLWIGQLEEMYRLGLSYAAAGLHDELGNLAGKLRNEANEQRGLT